MIDTQEGCSVMHDNLGDLLFYSDGVTVWDQSHSVMPNGIGLLGHFSSAQSALIVPKPLDPNRYYIFTTGSWSDDHGLNYSIVDMTLNPPFGDVDPLFKNIPLLPADSSTEKLTYVHHRDYLLPGQYCQAIWIITHKYETDEFVAYLLTEGGITETIVSSAGTVYAGDYFLKGGYLKANPDGDKLAAAIYGSNPGFELFDFDNSTGVVTFDLSFSSSAIYSYAVEFSPDGTILYFADFWHLKQYDIITPTLTTIATLLNSDPWFGAMQLGPDGKVYIARNGQYKIDVIHNPNASGTLCNYEESTVVLGPNPKSLLGLPSAYHNECVRAAFKVDTNILATHGSAHFTDISPGVVIDRLWNFPGGDPSSLTDPEPVVTYDTPGVYDVSLTITTEYGTDTEYKQTYIYVGTTGIDDPVSMMEEVFIYPNPGNGIFNIRTSYNNVSIEVFNLVGKRIFEIEDAGPYTVLDLSGLSKGMYLVRARKDDGAFLKVTKLVIQ